ncbi:ABC transporter ATP-binding protein [Orbus sasakiae]|uniref:ABC transporter ATP-binding protein n=1 Tax=Orbus sasakiae TaxID=1078475 RepID=A0ABP9N515_9GAMM
MFKNTLNLTSEGNKNLTYAIIICTLENLTLFLPFVVLLQMIVTLIMPLVTQTPLDTNHLWMLFAFGILSALLFFIVYRIEYRKTYTAAYNESMATRVEVAERMRKLPLSFFNQRNLADLTTNLMSNCFTIEHVMSHVVPQMIGYTLSSTIACIMLAVYDWRMALAIFCVLPLAAFIVFVGKKLEEGLSQQHIKAKLAVSDQVQEYLEGIKVIKAFGLSEQKFRHLDSSLKNMMKAAIKFEFLAGMFVTGSTILLQTGIGIVILVGVTLVSNGTLNIFAFLTFILVSTRIYAPIIALMTLLPEFFHFLQSLKSMQKLRRTEPMNGRTDIDLTNFDISLNDVTFAYNQVDVIKHATITIPANKVTAFVGPSGSGKTTLSRLIGRFWDVKSGSIIIGNQTIRDIDPDKLMSYMSFVFQDVILFNDTIFNNIRVGNENATAEQVYDAARKARCDEFIMRLPQSYDTVLSENGGTLSGGERQRISIARALLKNAPIILLDEATASLDPQNEVLIQQAISELIYNRTVIVIAHRLRTITNADQIIVLDHGHIIEQGNFKSLMAQSGLFYKLYTIQQQNQGWNIS